MPNPSLDSADSCTTRSVKIKKAEIAWDWHSFTSEYCSFDWVTQSLALEKPSRTTGRFKTRQLGPKPWESSGNMKMNRRWMQIYTGSTDDDQSPQPLCLTHSVKNHEWRPMDTNRAGLDDISRHATWSLFRDPKQHQSNADPCRSSFVFIRVHSWFN